MKKSAFLLIFLFVFVAATHAQARDEQFDPRISELVSQSVLQLANDIAKEVIKTSNPTSVVFSPLSIFAVLSTLLLGSNGKTYDELMRLLGYSNGKFISKIK